MKSKFKNAFLYSGIALASVAITLGVASGIFRSLTPIRMVGADTHTLVLNSSNKPTQSTSFQRTISSSVQTVDGNTLPISLNVAKYSEGNYVELGKNGYIYNFKQANGRIKGITSITPVLASGSLVLRTTNSELDNGGLFLGDGVALTSASEYTLPNPARYFQLKAGDDGAVITSLTIKYECTGSESVVPSQNLYNVEDFESYTDTGAGWDDGTGYELEKATNLRAAFYSTYKGSASDPLNGSGWTKMGGNHDYLLYFPTYGRNGSKVGAFKCGSGNNFRYMQMKEALGINSLIGKGATLSLWMHGPMKSDLTAFQGDVTVQIYAFYNAQFDFSAVNNATITTYTIQKNSDWIEYKLTLDSTKNYYAFGFCFSKTATSGNAYVLVDDVTIYTTSPYPAVPVTGVSVPSSLKLLSGMSYQLSATVEPWYADNQAVTWSSSNTAVATVDQDGTIHAVADGNSNIIATTVDGGYTATCALTVGEDYPTGNFFLRVPMYHNAIGNFDIPAIIAIGGKDGRYAVMLNNKDAQPTSMTYDKNTGALTIVTTGSYHVDLNNTDYSYGTITATYNKTLNQLENVGFDGDASAFLTQNNSMTFANPQRFWSCDGTDASLKSQFARRYWDGSKWVLDTNNADRITADYTNYIGGISGLKMRAYSSNNIALSLAENIQDTTSANIGFWIYNPSETAVKMNLYLYKTANVGSTSNDDRYEFIDDKAFNQGWTFYCVGMAYPGKFEVGVNTFYNFFLLVKSTSTQVTFDNICLYE